MSGMVGDERVERLETWGLGIGDWGSLGRWSKAGKGVCLGEVVARASCDVHLGRTTPLFLTRHASSTLVPR